MDDSSERNVPIDTDSEPDSNAPVQRMVIETEQTNTISITICSAMGTALEANLTLEMKKSIKKQLTIYNENQPQETAEPMPSHSRQGTSTNREKKMPHVMGQVLPPPKVCEKSLLDDDDPNIPVGMSSTHDPMWSSTMSSPVESELFVDPTSVMGLEPDIDWYNDTACNVIPGTNIIMYDNTNCPCKIFESDEEDSSDSS